MPSIDAQRPYPDYVTCPHCGEPEVEVWCYHVAAQCHACRQTFEHALPQACEGQCDDVSCERELGHLHGPIKLSRVS